MDVLAFDVLRNHVEAAVRQTGEVVEDGDVRVLDLGGDARFLGEALQGVRVGRPIGAQDLDDPQLLQMDVARAPDLAHAACGEAVEDLVLAVEDRPAVAFGHRGSWLLGPSFVEFCPILARAAAWQNLAPPESWRATPMTPLPPSAAGPSVASESRAAALACACLFFAMLNLTLVVAGLKELVVDELGGTIADAALFFTVEMVAYLLFAPLWGALSDRLGRRKPFIVAGFAASGLLYLAYLGIHSIPLLLALRFLQGGAAIAGWSTTLALLFDRADGAGADPARRPRLAGLAGASLILGVGLGAPLGGLVTQLLGRPRTTGARGSALPAARASGLELREATTMHIRPRLRAIGRALASRPRLLLPWGLYAMERFTVGLFVIVFPLWLLEQHGADPAARGRALAAFLLPFAFLQLGTYRLARRFGPFALLALGCFGYAVAFAALGRIGGGSYYSAARRPGRPGGGDLPADPRPHRRVDRPRNPGQRPGRLQRRRLPRLRPRPHRRRLGAPGRRLHRRLRPRRRRRPRGRPRGSCRDASR